MREQLVHYLLGELSREDCEKLESQLRANPALRSELEQLRKCMAGDESACEEAEIEPPQGLARRTIVQCLCPSSGVEPPQGKSCFSLLDASVTTGVVVTICMLLFPALRQGWDSSRRVTCENNLRQLHQAFVAYSQEHGNYFPHINLHQNAGTFTIYLRDSGVLKEEELRQALVCPSSPLAERVAAGQTTIMIPTFADLNRLAGPKLLVVRQNMGGSYAYRIGYLTSQGRYIPIKNRADCQAPLLADSPDPQSLRSGSSHHGAKGQNVLFQDGHVSFVGSWLPERDDNLYLNHVNLPAPGEGPGDTVALPSGSFPAVEAVAE